VAMEAAEIDLL